MVDEQNKTPDAPKASDKPEVVTETTALGLSKDDGSPVDYWDTEVGKKFKAAEKDRDKAALDGAEKAHANVTRENVQAVSSMFFTEEQIKESPLTVDAKEAAKIDKKAEDNK